MNFVRRGRAGVPETRVFIIGAGVGGLAAAIRLAACGVGVTVVERAPQPGGKVRQLKVGSAMIDSGPTVFTMRHVFDELLAEAGASFDDHLKLQPLEVLARHAWDETSRLDLFADLQRSADAIGTFAGAQSARGYLEFCKRARAIFQALDAPFIQTPTPSLPGLIARSGRRRPLDLWRISPFATLWGAMGRHFSDPRLRQLFARYATYCGSSPFRSPATLMLVAHVEQSGVWAIEGGMYRLVETLTRIATDLGVTFIFGEEVARVETAGARVSGVVLNGGERLEADAVVVNADVAAVAAGTLGAEIARSVSAPRRAGRSLSAVTWSLSGETSGFPLVRHTVFFGRDYRAEFDDIFRRRRLPADPTVYVCAQDRLDEPGPVPAGPERLFCIVNAPADGDAQFPNPSEIEQCEKRVFALMRSCGLQIERRPEATSVTTPAVFNRLFPATGGALYGRASHGWRASFQRPGVRTRIPGLYLAGGSAHPGPGVPMAALSGKMAADCLLSDLASTRKFHRVGTSGGTSTP